MDKLQPLRTKPDLERASFNQQTVESFLYCEKLSNIQTNICDLKITIISTTALSYLDFASKEPDFLNLFKVFL